MSFSKSKQTKRFTYTLNRNPSAKRAGSNILTIGTNTSDGQYNVPQASLTMTVREAQTLNSFLSQNLGDIETV